MNIFRLLRDTWKSGYDMRSTNCSDNRYYQLTVITSTKIWNQCHSKTTDNGKEERARIHLSRTITHAISTDDTQSVAELIGRRRRLTPYKRNRIIRQFGVGGRVSNEVFFRARFRIDIFPQIRAHRLSIFGILPLRYDVYRLRNGVLEAEHILHHIRSIGLGGHHSR